MRRVSGLVRSLAGHPDVQVAALCDLDEQALTKLDGDFALSDRHLCAPSRRWLLVRTGHAELYMNDELIQGYILKIF